MTDDRGELLIGGVWAAANSDNMTTVRSADTQQVIGALSKATTGLLRTPDAPRPQTGTLTADIARLRRTARCAPHTRPSNGMHASPSLPTPTTSRR
ncbi:hypothetical protein ACFYO0_26820 [Streptomyces sp. NPDC006365]|uniref:hypothetical protein n=1 Tax=Streptomyces sp. NPDC006365 TaxID=3364744 RepID=UPI0036C31249